MADSAKKEMLFDPLAISTLMRLKQSALSVELGSDEERILSRACGGSGMFTIARKIDSVVTALLKYQTEAADYKYLYDLSRDTMRQWRELGFYENPEDMSQDQQNELKALAAKFNQDEEKGEEENGD